MLYLRSRKIIFTLINLFLYCNLFAQRELNRPGHDEMPYYFGLQFGYANMNLLPNKDIRFINYDSVLSAEPEASGGFSVGFLATKKLNANWQARFAPQLIIGGARSFTYELKYPNAAESRFVKKNLTSTFISLPLQFKFQSERIDNFRVYMLGGASYDIDILSTSNSRNAEDLIKLKSGDFNIQAGVGCSLFLKFVTLSPELKLNTGLTNVHARDPNLKFSNVFDKLYSRSLMFTINIEQ